MGTKGNAESKMLENAIQVVCALIEQDGRILACRRADDGHLGGLWEFPGGKVEAGEDHTEALEREIKEELSVEIRIIDPLSSVAWDYGEIQIQLHPYRCRIISGTLKPIEHSATKWCGPSEFDDLKWADADVPICDEWKRGMTGENCHMDS